MRACVPTETEQRQREWMGDDFADPLRLGYSSINLFMGNFLMPIFLMHSLILKLYDYISFCLFVRFSTKCAQGTRSRALSLNPNLGVECLLPGCLNSTPTGLQQFPSASGWNAPICLQICRGNTDIKYITQVCAPPHGTICQLLIYSVPPFIHL